MASFMGVSFGSDCKRTEEIKITLTFDKGAADQHRRLLRDTFHDDTRYICDLLRDGDTGHLTYTFGAQYFGDVARKLAVILEIAQDPRVIVDAGAEELVHGRSLILEIGALLERFSQLRGGH